jgi:hypothetical protein
MWPSLRALLFNPRTLLVVYIGAAIIAAVQLYSLGTHTWTFPKDPFPKDIMNQPQYMNLFYNHKLTEYNNYVIFKHSFFHLRDTAGSHGYTEHGLYGLYGVHPEEHWDFFKYSPTFALLMGSLAYLPDIVGLLIWNILNALAVFWAIRMLPFNVRTRCLLMWFIAMELLTCLQNTQSNGLMCGLMIAAYGCMQHRKVALAALWLALATYIKVYGAIGFCLFLFYPDKLKFIAYSALWMLVFAVLPLAVISPANLSWQYQNWAYLLKADASAAMGLSVAGWLHTWFGLNDVKTLVTIGGIILFFIPFARVSMYKNEVFRLLILAFMLIWVIIFNHKAESSTFIIALAGVGIWYFASPKSTWHQAVLWLVFIFTSLSTTDIFPPYVKTHFVYPYTIKAVPCILVCFIVFIELMTLKRNTRLAVTENRPEYP